MADVTAKPCEHPEQSRRKSWYVSGRDRNLVHDQCMACGKVLYNVVRHVDDEQRTNPEGR